MNKFLFSLAFMLSFFSIHAQSQASRDEMQTLVQRVDSLEHELAYLKLTYKLNTLKSDIVIFANEMHAKSLEIQLHIYNNNKDPDSRLKDSYQKYYETCKARKQAFTELIEATKTFFVMKVFRYPYSESELNELMSTYKLISTAPNLLEASMDLLKSTIEAYIKLM